MTSFDLTLCTGCKKVRTSSPGGICAACSNRGVMTTETKQLCEGAWSIPPSPLMLRNGNDYHTCSICGEKADAPMEDVRTVTTLGSPDSPILLQFRELKKQRMHHLIDEPDFDAGVMALINRGVHSALEELEKEFDVLRPQDDVTFTREFALSAIKTLKEKYR